MFTVPRGTQPSECRAKECRATIYWIKTSAGKAMPVDCEVEGGQEPNAHEDGLGVSHFATCAAANRFRRD